MLTAFLVLYALVITVLFVIVTAGSADLVKENRRLRGEHLRPVHPSTRRNPR